MIGDYSEEPVAFAIRHLIDADPQQPVEPLAVQLFPDDPLHDAIDGLPATPEQLADRGLVGVLSEPRHDVLEVPAVPGPGPGPRHLLGPDPSAASAVQPADLRLQPHLRRAPVKVPPASHRPVIDPRATLPARTHRPGSTAPQLQHQPLCAERHDIATVPAGADFASVMIWAPSAWLIRK